MNDSNVRHVNPARIAFGIWAKVYEDSAPEWLAKDEALHRLLRTIVEQLEAAEVATDETSRALCALVEADNA